MCMSLEPTAIWWKQILILAAPQTRKLPIWLWRNELKLPAVDLTKFWRYRHNLIFSGRMSLSSGKCPVTPITQGLHLISQNRSASSTGSPAPSHSNLRGQRILGDRTKCQVQLMTTCNLTILGDRTKCQVQFNLRGQDQVPGPIDDYL
jgi:hypothetical protein